MAVVMGATYPRTCFTMWTQKPMPSHGQGQWRWHLYHRANVHSGRNGWKAVAYTPKKPGRTVERRKSVATIESGKWVGPVPTPLTGEIVEVNEALKTNPALVNDDPYGQGWIAKIKPTNPDEVNMLLKGQAAVDALTKVANEKGIKCG